MLESFFSAVRLRGAFTNNPTCHQFQYAMHRLMSRQQIVVSQTGNCSPDDIPILTVSSSTSTGKNSNIDEPEEDCEDEELEELELFHFKFEVPSEYVQEVIIHRFIFSRLKHAK